MDLKCEPCNKTFSNRFSLKRHREFIHGIICKRRLDGIDVHSFTNLSDFLQWKEKMENETGSRYVKNRSSIYLSNGVGFLYYECHRSGTYTPKGRGLRRMKVQNTAKIGERCSARLKVKIKDGTYFVQHFKQHDRHSVQLEHLSLQNSVKEKIAEKLNDGIPTSRIVEEVAEEAMAKSNDVVDRTCFITRRDVYNIKRFINTGHGKWGQRKVTGLDLNCDEDSENDIQVTFGTRVGNETDNFKAESVINCGTGFAEDDLRLGTECLELELTDDTEVVEVMTTPN